MDTMFAKEERRRFQVYLHREERAENTISKYLQNVEQFFAWLDGRELTKEAVAAWKEHLQHLGRAVPTVNGSLAALHSFLEFSGRKDCRVKYLRRQRQLFRDASRDLSKEEYEKLVGTAIRTGDCRLALLFETICATGIRVSELKYITVESVQRGQTTVSLKGKIRTILIPGKLIHKLKKYAKKEKIVSGEIFRTRTGKPLSRRQIWGDMKKICETAGVDASKVFPHNLRHLFARAFYKASKDIVKLANVLGHSSVETTRIYLITTFEEHTRELDKMRLVL